jgi:hypothetical protein
MGHFDADTAFQRGSDPNRSLSMSVEADSLEDISPFQSIQPGDQVLYRSPDGAE